MRQATYTCSGGDIVYVMSDGQDDLWHCQNPNINEKLLGLGFSPENDSACTMWTDSPNLPQSWKGSSTDSKKPHVLWKSQFLNLYPILQIYFNWFLKQIHSEKFTVENILNIWISDEEKYWQNKKIRRNINDQQSLCWKADNIIKRD